MSSEAMAWALRADLTGPLTTTERLILVVMADGASTNGVGSFFSRKTISERVGVPFDTVRRVQRSLETKGVIRRGDQRRVHHIPAYARPTVYDLQLGRRVNPAESNPDREDPRQEVSTEESTAPPTRGVTGDPGSLDNRGRGHSTTERGGTGDPQTKNRTSIDQPPPNPPAGTDPNSARRAAADCHHGTPNGTWEGTTDHAPGWVLCSICRTTTTDSKD